MPEVFELLLGQEGIFQVNIEEWNQTFYAVRET